MKSHEIILSGAQCFVGGKFQSCSLKIVDGFVQEIATSIPARPESVVLNLEGTAIMPGLINAHDHLEFNLFKRIGTPPYPNYVAWGEDIHKRHKRYIQEVIRVPLRLRLLWGAYKNIFSGVTTVVHHNDFYFDFRVGYPLEVLRKYTWIHSLALDDRLERKLKVQNGGPCIIHLAEGIDELAETELSRLIAVGGLTKDTVLVHGVGLTVNDIARIEKVGASLVWCPSSNDFLFHRTTRIEQALGRIRVALGTDSTLTGNPSLLDEIRCAQQLKQIEPQQAIAMVTSTPADIFGIDKGVIEEGKAADLLLFDCEGQDPIDRFLRLNISKIKGLLKKGVPLYGDTSLVQSFRVSSGRYTGMEVLKKKKMVRGKLGGLMRRISQYLPSFDFNGLPIELDSAA